MPIDDERTACPYVYSNGKRRPGHIVRVEAFKADLGWALEPDGTWRFSFSAPRSHHHLFRSEKGTHAGYSRPDSDQMKFYYGRLPEAVKEVIRRPEP